MTPYETFADWPVITLGLVLIFWPWLRRGLRVAGFFISLP